MRAAFVLSIVLFMPFTAQAQTYALGDDSGSYTLPTGSKVNCITVAKGNGQNVAGCTMQLKNADLPRQFPEYVTRHGKTFKVLSGKNFTYGRAWTDCEGNCINSK